MKLTKVITILIILFFVSTTNASTDKIKIENSFLKDSIEENNPIQSGKYYFVFGRVDNVDRGPGRGYDHCWEFHIIKALVISEEIQGIKIYTNKWITTTYEGFFGILSNNFVCAFMV